MPREPLLPVLAELVLGRVHEDLVVQRLAGHRGLVGVHRDAGHGVHVRLAGGGGRLKKGRGEGGESEKREEAAASVGCPVNHLTQPQ